MPYILNPDDGTYLSPDQIVADLHRRITDAEVLAWLRSGMQPVEAKGWRLAEYQKGGLGRWIRNTYGMWCQDNPYVCINDPASDFSGVRYFSDFPDNLSAEIVERFIDELNSETLVINLSPASAAYMHAAIDVFTRLLIDTVVFRR